MTYRLTSDEWARTTESNRACVVEALDQLERDYPFGFLADLGRWVTCHQIDFAQLREDQAAVQGLFNQLKLRQPDRQELWERFNTFRQHAREAQREFFAERDRILNENYSRLYHAINQLEVGHDLNWVADFMGFKKNLKEFWSDAAEVGQLFKECKPLRREQREELWNWFQSLRDRVHQLQQEAFEERDRSWREHQHELLDRWNALVEKNESVIRKIREDIDRCEDLRDDAKSADFADTVQGWIDEKERKMDDIEETNRELWDKIRDVERRLNG